jgi:hypothetical protein
MLWSKKTKRKTKKSPLRSLTAKLDRVFSEFIRRRDADRYGYVECCTCTTKKHWKNMHAGHFVGREARNTRWEEQNVHGQCPGCNTFHEGRKPEYTIFLINKYGPDIIERLVLAGKQVKKWSPIELEDLIHYYQEGIKHFAETQAK